MNSSHASTLSGSSLRNGIVDGQTRRFIAGWLLFNLLSMAAAAATWCHEHRTHCLFTSTQESLGINSVQTTCPRLAATQSSSPCILQCTGACVRMSAETTGYSHLWVWCCPRHVVLPVRCKAGVLGHGDKLQVSSCTIRRQSRNEGWLPCKPVTRHSAFAALNLPHVLVCQTW